MGLYDDPLKRRGLGDFPCTMLIAQHPSRRLRSCQQWGVWTESMLVSLSVDL